MFALKNDFLIFFLFLTITSYSQICENQINITTEQIYQSTSIRRQSANSLIARNTVRHGAFVTYTANNYLELKENFNVQLGSKFNGYISSCKSNYKCSMPYQVIAIVNSDSSVSVDWKWESPSDISFWEINILEEGKSINNAYNKQFSGKLPFTIPIDSLKSNTRYLFSVRSVCNDGNKSDYALSNSFLIPKFTKLLWDNGVKLHNYYHNNDTSVYPRNNNIHGSYCPINSFKDLLPITIDRPKTFEKIECYTGGFMQPLNETGALLLLNSVNYKTGEFLTQTPYGDFFGYKFTINDKNPYSLQDPLEFNIFNQMLKNEDYENFKELHEVGLTFNHWNSNRVGKWAFQKGFKLSEFNNDIIVSFKAKINKSDVLSTDVQKASSFLSADLRLAYYNEKDEKIGQELIGILFYDQNLQMSDSSKNIYWEQYPDSTSNFYDFRRLIRSNNKICNENYQEFTFRFKDLINSLPLINNSINRNEAIIAGFDIYSHVRGKADLNFSVKDIKIIGLDSNLINSNSRKIDSKNTFKITPNPSNGIFSILIKNKCDGKIEILNKFGEKINIFSFVNLDKIDINLINQPSDIYIINLILENNLYTEKLIKY